MMNKKGFAPLLILLLGLAIMGAVALGYSSIGNVFTDYSNVYKLNYGHVCCLPDALETLDGPRYADDVTSTSCDDNVDECKIILTSQFSPLFTLGSVVPQWRTCNIEGGSCSSWSSVNLQKGATHDFTIAVGKKIEFRQGFGYDAKYYTWERKGAVYNLVGEENGRIFVENGCDLSSELKGKVLSGIPNTIPKGYSNCINYVTDFIQVATKTYTYSGDEVICQARAIYEIDEETFKDGSDVKVQGEKIKDVQCCPTESNCGTDFKFSSSVKRECTYSTECDNGGDLYGISQTTAGYFVCESGTCVKKTQSVECTSDAVCQARHGEGYTCDLSNDNWGNCIESPEGTYCGDGYCDVGESKSTCASDCELECAEGEKIVTREKNIPSLTCPLGLGGICAKSTEKTCESTFDWTKIFLAVLIFLIIVVALLKFAFHVI